MVSKKEIKQAKNLTMHLYNDAKFHDDGCNIKDNFHSMSELYFNRMILFDLLMKSHPEYAWKSKLHSDGTMFTDYFIVGFTFKDETSFTYHFHIKYWDIFSCVELVRAPEYDGHLPQDIYRLYKLLEEDGKKDEFENPCYFIDKEMVNKIAKLYDPKKNNCFIGHQWNDHIVKVIRNCQMLCGKFNIPYTFEIEVGAALHDIGLLYGRKDHETEGVVMVGMLFNDGFFKDYYITEDMVHLIEDIVRYHRASVFKKCSIDDIPKDPSIMVVNLADKNIINKTPREIFVNAYLRTFKVHFANGERANSLDKVLLETEEHIRNKYGKNGYLWLNPLALKNVGESAPELIEAYLDNLSSDKEITEKTMEIIEKNRK